MTKITKQQVHEFIKDWNEHKSAQEIAEKIGVKRPTILNWAKELRNLGIDLEKRSSSSRKEIFKEVAREYTSRKSE